MRRFDGRLRRLEAARNDCPGAWKVPMYRCYAWAEDRLSKLDDRCLLCGLDHEPATEYPPTIRQIVVVVPEGEADDEIGPAGWVDEMELWERRREKP